MGFQFKTFAALEKEFEESKKALEAKHNAASTEGLSEERRIQRQFIDVVIARLKDLPKMKDETETQLETRRAYILSGVMYTVFDRVKETATGVILASHSLFQKQLQAIIGISDKNELDNDNLSKMTKAAGDFYNSILYPKGNTKEKMKVDHPFKDITGLDTKFLQDFYDRSKKISESASKLHNVEKLKELDKEQKRLADEKKLNEKEKKGESSSWMPNLFGSKKEKEDVSKKKPAPKGRGRAKAKEVEDEEVENEVENDDTKTSATTM